MSKSKFIIQRIFSYAGTIVLIVFFAASANSDNSELIKTKLSVYEGKRNEHKIVLSITGSFNKDLNWKLFHDSIEDDYLIDHGTTDPKGIVKVISKKFHEPVKYAFLLITDESGLIVKFVEYQVEIQSSYLSTINKYFAVILGTLLGFIISNITFIIQEKSKVKRAKISGREKILAIMELSIYELKSRWSSKDKNYELPLIFVSNSFDLSVFKIDEIPLIFSTVVSIRELHRRWIEGRNTPDDMKEINNILRWISKLKKKCNYSAKL